MSIFSGIESAAKTFAAWAEKEEAKLLGKTPTFLSVADVVLGYAGPILVALLTGVGDAPAAAEANAIITEAISDITVVRGVLEDAGPTPSALAILASIQTNLSGLLTAEHVTNPVSVALVNKVLGEFALLVKAFPPTVVATAAA